jgi:L-lysine exporter family protein LysE/ArgO
MSTELESLASGLLFGLSLIIVIGAQNTYVLQQGLLRQHVTLVVSICTISDITLIGAGVSGTGAALAGHSGLQLGVRTAGATFLFAYAAIALWRARRAVPGFLADSPAKRSRSSVALTCLALTWLNPGVYLDTVVVLGSVAHARPGNPWWFAGGAMAASVIWFAALGFGARLLAPLFRRPRASRVLDVSVAVIMVITGIRVLLSS